MERLCPGQAEQQQWPMALLVALSSVPGFLVKQIVNLAQIRAASSALIILDQEKDRKDMVAGKQSWWRCQYCMSWYELSFGSCARNPSQGYQNFVGPLAAQHWDCVIDSRYFSFRKPMEILTVAVGNVTVKLVEINMHLSCTVLGNYWTALASARMVILDIFRLISGRQIWLKASSTDQEQAAYSALNVTEDKLELFTQ